jgi:uncharacterized protein YvpB
MSTKIYKILILIWVSILVVILGFHILLQYSCYTTKEQIIDHISKQTIVQEVEVKPETKYILVEREIDTSKYIELRLDVDNVEQNPELPTGCEVTALTTVLNYLNYDVDKLILADLFLPKGEIGQTHPDEAFIGNPRDKNSYGANAPVIVNTANDYLERMDSKHKAYNVSNTEFSELTKYLYDGYPVIVWGTINMKPSYPSTKWNLDSGEYQWYSRFHCMVLVGFTEDKYIIADPLNKGLTYYDKDLVETRYNELNKQAVVIY